MSTENDVARSLGSWLKENRHEDPDRVLDLVLDQIPATPQRRAGWPAWRFPPMSSTSARLGVAAAAILLALILGVTLLRPNVGGPPEATPTPSAAATTPADGSLPQGPHLLSEQNVRISVAIPASGWHGEPGEGVVEKDETGTVLDTATMAVFIGEHYVPDDICHWQSTIPDNPASTVDDLVASLAAQGYQTPEFPLSRDPSEPVEVTVGGYAASSVTLHVPDYWNDDDPGGCDDQRFCSLVQDPASGECSRYHLRPNQIDTFWIVDVNGELVIVDAASWLPTPTDYVDEMNAMVESMTFE